MESHRHTRLTRIARRSMRRSAEHRARRTATETVRDFDASLDVGREYLDHVEKRARGIESRAADHASRTEFLDIRREKGGDVDHRSFVLTPGFHGENLDDGKHVRVLHRILDRPFLARPDRVLHIAQQHLLASQLPSHDSVGHGHAAVAVTCLSGIELGHPQHVLADLRRRQFVIDLVLDAVHAEETNLRLGFFRDHLVIRLDAASRFFRLLSRRFGRRRHLLLGSFFLLGRLSPQRYGPSHQNHAQRRSPHEHPHAIPPSVATHVLSSTQLAKSDRIRSQSLHSMPPLPVRARKQEAPVPGRLAEASRTRPLLEHPRYALWATGVPLVRGIRTVQGFRLL